MNFARPFVRRPIASVLLAVALMLAGILSWRLLAVAPLPQVDFPTIEVTASLPGAGPENMASSVAAPLERAMGSIAGVTALTSSSTTGSTRVRIEFALDRNIHDAGRDVQAAINAARGQLPAGMPGSPTYRKVNPSQAPIMGLALASPNLAPGALYDAASTILAQKLSQVVGVGEVTVDGASLPAVRVQLDPNALAHYGISLDEVRAALANANSLRPRGAVEEGEHYWQLRVSDQLRTAAEYEPLIVRYRDGATVRLGDVAKVTDSVENRYSSGFHNHDPAVILMVNRQPGANIVQTVDAIYEQLPALRALLPEDMSLTVVLDRSPGIRATLAEAQVTLVLSSVLVMLVVLLFLGNLRAALIPSVAIPVSLVGTFSIMYLYGFSLNNLSLMALIVAAGLVVDDAIVVLENIERHIERGLSPYRAALRGVSEVGFTLLAMNVALIVVFLSILFMGGLVERLFREFSITLAGAMLISLLVSLTLTPSLCARMLPARGARAPSALQRGAQQVFAQAQHYYASSLDVVLRHGAITLLVLAAVVALNVYLYMAIPKSFLPQQDTGQLRAFARGDDGFSFQVMQPKLDTYRKLVLADPAVQDVMGSSGGRTGISNSFMMVRLKPQSERTESANDVVNRLRANQPQVPGGMFFSSVDQDINLPGSFSSSDQELILKSDELGPLRMWAKRVSEALKELPELTDVDSVGDGETKQITLDIDREAARRLGVDMNTVTQVLNNSFSQRQVATLYGSLNQYRVVMELAPQYTASPSVLEQVQVITADGARVPLSSFATYSYGVSNDRVSHSGQFAAIGLGFSLAPGVTMEQAMAAIDGAMARIMLPTEIQRELGGSAKRFVGAVQDQPLLILAVLIAVYLVLGILYESVIHPLTILSTLPSAGIGALLALRATGTEFSLIALLGLFLLIGIVMKNAILMIDFALASERRTGATPLEAIREAALMRLRPIVMTNLAGLLGALPLVFGTGSGAEMRQPLGIAIVGGLAVSQILTLYTTPVVYLYLDRLRLRAQRAWGQRASARRLETEP